MKVETLKTIGEAAVCLFLGGVLLMGVVQMMAFIHVAHNMVF